MEKKMKIILQPYGPEGGDCTQNYDVFLNKRLKLIEFIDCILLNRKEDFGRISVGKSKKYRCIEYNKGTIKNEVSFSFSGKELEAYVVDAHAYGGYGQVNYEVYLD